MIIDECGTITVSSMHFYRNMPMKLFQQTYGPRVHGVVNNEDGILTFKDLVSEGEISYRIEAGFISGKLNSIELYPVKTLTSTEATKNLMQAYQTKYDICRQLLVKIFGSPDETEDKSDVSFGLVYKQVRYNKNGAVISTGFYYNPREDWPSGGCITIVYS